MAALLFRLTKIGIIFQKVVSAVAILTHSICVFSYKKQIEDAEEIAALNLAKFRKSQQQLEEAEERSRCALQYPKLDSKPQVNNKKS